MKNQIDISVATGVPVFGVYVPDRNIPHLMLPFRDVRILLSLEYSNSGFNDVVLIRGVGGRAGEELMLADIIKNFIREVKEFLGFRSAFRVRVEYESLLSPLQLYAASTMSILSAMREYLNNSVLDKNMIISLGERIDRRVRLKIPQSIINAYRIVSMEEKPVVYRRGEGVVVLPFTEVLSGFANMVKPHYWSDYEIKYFLDHPLMDVVVHGISITVIESAKKSSESVDILSSLFEAEVHLQKIIIKGGGKCNLLKLFPDIAGALAVSINTS